LLSEEIINQHEGEGEKETWELCGRHTVDSEKSLLDFVSKHRLGIATNNHRIDYPLLHVHIRRLVQTGDLIHLASQGMLYAVPRPHSGVIQNAHHCQRGVLYFPIQPNGVLVRARHLHPGGLHNTQAICFHRLQAHCAVSFSRDDGNLARVKVRVCSIAMILLTAAMTIVRP